MDESEQVSQQAKSEEKQTNSYVVYDVFMFGTKQIGCNMKTSE